ncbi:Outer membrane receptor proteins, mostly Fe transport [Pseudarcicella hirudinis]|uniref:Outer membrane receptor proteins, mostly Fe transport n=2 Tax=Pseudarcicella hirudinis TaxID=1079859 RepID=A0A1I5MDG0_9BACT|nr:TonB-dependent receptor [Pseudarcicella hirudinis]SFP07595.1 Outer membrane receptor proteins, mostly Fe transport [Pseudarcicella hirudinis]
MKLLYKLYILTILLLGSFFSLAQNPAISGKVTDAETKKPLTGVSIYVKGKIYGTVSDAQGNFNLNISPPATLVISMIGYKRVEIAASTSPMNLSMQPSSEELDQVVISASRIEENILRSPVSIEKMDIRAIQQSPSANYFDGLVNLKSLDMVTSSLTYKQINTRGFNSTGNSRFLQLVDGVDNQPSGLGFAMGNLFGPHDIDVESVELIPGAASALYGPIAFNGMLNTRTKNPFIYQGLSVQTKFGINHIGDGTGLGAKPMGDYAIRYAKAFNNRFAFKLNTSYLTGTDWYANNYTDIDPNTPEANRGPNNPGRNALNIYGDEVAKTIDKIGRVSRTGYEEKDLATYGVYSLKLNGALHYRITDNLEAIYQANFNQGTAQYTGSSRFVINDFRFIQHRLELKGSNFYIRAYSNQELSTNSYNTRSLGQLINRTWVRDLNGNVVSPDKADATWFDRYTAAFNGTINGVSGQNNSLARAFADQGRLLPGSTEFEQAKDKLIQTRGLSGAGILSNCSLKHIEGLYDFSQYLKVFNLQVGGNYRKYYLDTEGTLFDDKGKNLTNEEYGAFAQVSKDLLNKKLKVTFSGRYDKNENFDGRFTPRASAVFSPSDQHHFRASYQTGFRNPTIGDQYIKLNVGPIIILGGAPVNAAGTNAYENSYTAASVGAFGSAFGADLAKGVPFPQAVENNKNKLKKSNVPFIKSEKVQSFEIGYKGLLSPQVLFDVNYYYSQYTDFLINTVVIRPNSNVTSPDGSINTQAATDILTGGTQAFQLYTNAADKVSIQGISAGLTLSLPKNYRLNGNATWIDFNLMNADPNNIPAFNTPTWKTNLTLSNSNVAKNLGFSLAWHWQTAFDWYGTFNELRPGLVPAYSLIDAQISLKVPALKSVIKLGASNLTNQYITQAYGSPAVGGLYYVSLNFDELLR